MLSNSRPSRLRNYLAYGLCALVMVASSPTQAQNTDDVSKDLELAIQTKSQELRRFSAQRAAGEQDEAVETLRKIVDLHRRILQIGERDHVKPEVITQLWQVFADDGGFLADELFARAEYSTAAALRKEIEQLLTDRLGAEHQATQSMHWKAVTAAKLNDADDETRAAYLAAAAIVPQAREAIRSQQAQTAAPMWSQIVAAYVAVLGDSHPDVALVMNESGATLWSLQQYEDAEVILKRSLQAREDTTGKDLEYAITAINLARTYAATDRYAEAEPHFLTAAEIQSVRIGDSSAQYLQTLQWLGELYEATGETDKSVSIQQRIASADPVRNVLSHLPTAAYAAALVLPAQTTRDQQLQLMPFEVIEAAGQEQLGFSPLDVEVAVGFMTAPILQQPFNYGVAFKLKPQVEVQYGWVKQMEVVEYRDGTSYMKDMQHPHGLSFAEFDDGVVVLGTEETIRQCLLNAGPSTVSEFLLSGRYQGQIVAAIDIRPVRPILVGALHEGADIPTELEDLKTLPFRVETVQVGVNFAEGFRVTMRLNCADEETAESAAGTIRSALKFGIDAAMKKLDRELAGEENMQIALRTYAQRMAREYLTSLIPVVTESSASMQLEIGQREIGPMVASILLPAIQAARDAAARGAAGDASGEDVLE